MILILCLPERSVIGKELLDCWRRESVACLEKCRAIPQYRVDVHQVGRWKRNADGSVSWPRLSEPGKDSENQVLVLTLGYWGGTEDGT